MAQADALQQALARFGASLDTLERFLAQLFEDRDSTAKLKEQVRSLTDERNRLASERDRLAALARVAAVGRGRAEGARRGLRAGTRRAAVRHDEPRRVDRRALVGHVGHGRRETAHAGAVPRAAALRVAGREVAARVLVLDARRDPAVEDAASGRRAGARHARDVGQAGAGDGVTARTR